jgi:hypothetical protein
MAKKQMNQKKSKKLAKAKEKRSKKSAKDKEKAAAR